MTMRKPKRLLVALATAATFGLAAATSASANTPQGVPGEQNCFGHTQASKAQDWKAFPFEPRGFGPLSRFYGATPQEGKADSELFCAGG
jgi:hypothetical protein